ncbi:Uncharacterised protein [[Pasteurella] mairii]|uniref:Uncharacterized protein n=1 Tax=[Pasteurella] mairii TaxID=757 RepID=A0A379B6F1_9PAST|nr:Uncharacterised protein [[Pasteurella] mairii]
MNKIFKCKYDVTSGITKVVSELATNQQLASQTTRSTPPLNCSFLAHFTGFNYTDSK